MLSFSNADTDVSDSRAGANDQAAAVGGGKGAQSKINYAGIGGINVDNAGIGQFIDNRKAEKGRLLGGGGEIPTNGGSTGNVGDISVNTSIITNDPKAAIAAVENARAIAGDSIAAQNFLASLSMETNQRTIDQVLSNQTRASEAQQSFVEKTVAGAIESVKQLALPANERGFNTTLYIVGGLTLVFLFFRYKKSK